VMNLGLFTITRHWFRSCNSLLKFVTQIVVIARSSYEFPTGCNR
jgi:hypothetical protein